MLGEKWNIQKETHLKMFAKCFIWARQNNTDLLYDAVRGEILRTRHTQ